jgi:hypothetical protein
MKDTRQKKEKHRRQTYKQAKRQRAKMSETKQRCFLFVRIFGCIVVLITSRLIIKKTI